MDNNQRPPTVAAWIKKTKRGDDYLSIKLKDGTKACWTVNGPS